MSESAAKPGTGQQEVHLHEINGVPVYARKDEQGRPSKVDAIAQDEEKIRAIADRLQRRGFGVMRQRNPRAGKIFYTLKATWTNQGDPPDDPFGPD